MRFLLFIILFLGVTTGLYVAGIQYEEQTEERIAFDEFAAPKLAEIAQLKDEITQLEAQAAQEEEDQLQKEKEALDAAQSSKNLSSTERLAAKLLDSDADDRNQELLDKEDAIQDKLTQAKEHVLAFQREKLEKINQNNTRLDQTKVGKRNDLGRKFASKTSSSAYTKASQQLEIELSELDLRVSQANAALKKEIDDEEAKLESLEQSTKKKLRKLDKLRSQLDDVADAPADKLGKPLVRAIIKKASGEEVADFDTSTSETNALILKKTERLEKLDSEVVQHPYAVARQDYILGLPFQLLGILIVADAFIMAIIFSILRPRSL
jgi:chromosome segregation ATPase